MWRKWGQFGGSDFASETSSRIDLDLSCWYAEIIKWLTDKEFIKSLDYFKDSTPFSLK